MTYGTAPTSGGTGDAVTTDTIATIDGGAGTFGEAQLVKLGYGAQSDLNVVSATQPFPTALSQTPFVPNAANTTSANLAPGATFVGAITANPSQPSISINVLSDQPVILRIKQSSDAAGVNALPDLIPPQQLSGQKYAHNVCVAANSNYWWVTVQNVGSATTTQFNVDTGTGWLWPVTTLGNTPVSIAEVGGAVVSGSLPVTVQETATGLLVRQVESETSSSSARSVFVSGDPGGDFANVNLIEEVVAGNLQLSVNTADLRKDPMGSLIQSDSELFIASASQASTTVGILTMDCRGYSSVMVAAMAGTGACSLWFSEGGVTWTRATNGLIYITANTLPVSFGSGGSTTFSFSAGAGGIANFPVLARYAQLRMDTVTTGPCTVGVRAKTAQFAPYLPTSSSSGTLAVTPAATTNLLGDVGIQYRTSSTGAATISKFTATATTNAASIKASAGRVIGWSLVNTTAAIKVFRFFNKASAPTMGTDSPAFVVYLAANGRSDIAYEGGLAFGTGIAIACTGAIADLDTTATAANDVLGAIFYA